MKIEHTNNYIMGNVADLKQDQIGEIINRPDLEEKFLVRVNKDTVVGLPNVSLWTNGTGSGVTIRILNPGESITLIQE